jgi:hypothetical protein
MLRKGDIFDAVRKLIMEKKKIRGILVIRAKRGSSETIGGAFWSMIFERGWANKNFVYIVSGRNGLRGYKVISIKGRRYEPVSLTKIKGG